MSLPFLSHPSGEAPVIAQFFFRDAAGDLRSLLKYAQTGTALLSLNQRWPVESPDAIGLVPLAGLTGFYQGSIMEIPQILRELPQAGTDDSDFLTQASATITLADPDGTILRSFAAETIQGIPDSINATVLFWVLEEQEGQVLGYPFFYGETCRGLGLCFNCVY